jgi:RNA polymerase sigma factor (sigma-70 family)
MDGPTMLPQAQTEPAAGRAAPADEVSLVAAVAAGNLQAFETLYRIYHPRLTRFLERMTRRPTLVDEVLNDTLLVVWHRASTYNGKSLVSTWIFAIAYRKALKALKRFDEPADDEGADERVEPGPGPEQNVGHDQLRSALLRALDGLTPEHRAVVDLTYFHDLGYREIAEIVDCPVDTVKTRMFYARRRLRALLPGEREDWL